jgi:hypothetical protein
MWLLLLTTKLVSDLSKPSWIPSLGQYYDVISSGVGALLDAEDDDCSLVFDAVHTTNNNRFYSMAVLQMDSSCPDDSDTLLFVLIQLTDLFLIVLEWMVSCYDIEVLLFDYWW